MEKRRYLIYSIDEPAARKFCSTDEVATIIDQMTTEGLAPLWIEVVPKFKVGDTVVVIDSNIDVIPAGSRVTIEKFLGTTKENFYRVDGGWAFYESQLKKG
jgi:hypothetical protein